MKHIVEADPSPADADVADMNLMDFETNGNKTPGLDIDVEDHDMPADSG